MRRLTGLAKWVRLLRGTLRGAPRALPLGTLLFMAKMMRHAKLTELDGRTFTQAIDPPLESCAYQVAAEGLVRIARGEHRLLTLCISPTLRCPMRCVYCYARNHPPGPELSTRRLKDLIREALDLGVYSIHYSGGEPLLRDDLPELIASTGEGATTLLMTSGFRFPEMSRDLRSAGLRVVEISLDTFDAEAFNRRRGHPDAFGIAMTAIHTAIADGFYTVLGMCIDAPMLAPAAFERYVREAARLGVHEIRVFGPRASVALGRHRFKTLTRKQVARVHDFQVRFNGMAHLPTVTSMDAAEHTDRYGCTGGTVYAHVSASGELTPCTMSPISFGNVTERPLAEVYANMRRHYPRPLAQCPLPRVWHLIKDVGDAELPVRDGDLVRQVTDRLHRGSRSPAAFWKTLGLRKEKAT